MRTRQSAIGPSRFSTMLHKDSTREVTTTGTTAWLMFASAETGREIEIKGTSGPSPPSAEKAF